MKQKAILSFCCITLVITTFLTSCDSAGGQVNNNNPEIVRQSASSVTETDINNSASCWLHSLDTSFDEWVGDGECTALARFLTNARGYGKDENGGFLGGADYVIQQQKKGSPIPLLAEIISDIKPCDNLILVGPKYVAAGHTVVVFYPDLVNDKIYYLDQNYNGEGITLRSLSVSKNENSTYVISAECKPDYQEELSKCQSGITQKLIVAAPGPSAQPELSTTLVSATVQAPSNNSSALTINGCKIEPYTQCEYANLPDASLSGAYLDNANLRHALLVRADLREADLREADLSYANLIHADLAGASMVSADLREADLREADLNGAHLGDVSLQHADLRWATLTNAYLVSANAEYVNLTGADLSGADLRFAFLLSADLSYANLRDTNLREATLFRVDLSGADLSGANLEGAEYDEETIWPSSFDPIAAGAVLESSHIYE